ncbi:MAG: molybdopterin-dependent oxidoreductase [Deltaproteobacteria bacterium]|nr:molybdopterin-dependent oxidoreductase [Deltaproteobacteria bacterium]MBW1923804.1 molybdopterin-dependent oxidoreductase [Deltaproteobacteria bacterium]MBW1949308.1 molybdopterin-dependent oxidoreductase [Deltaproteobacteria bacterium]MBW2009102.1 molybdopterin-dependent oxidoreductase [Deltaproteobacteria bacterium]MBW2102681.1 molybdopterin-dependent oxidoreductase [Deltaproteobacteria bacterium]
MTDWKKTSCAMCAQNCGLEVRVRDNRIVKVRPDRDNPRSEGYVCRKGLNIAYHQHHEDRLSHPLKRVGDRFEPISWDQAVEEIAERLQAIVKEHGPRSFAYMGGGGQGCNFEAAFGVRLLRGMGSRYHYSALAQELTGHFWAWGRATGRQYLFGLPDHHKTDVLLAMGWNGMMSHQMPQARRFLTKFAKDPDKVLVVVDPRRSETARIADIHLAVRPGTDALLTRAMIAIICREGWENREYIERHVHGYEEILPLFRDFDARAAVEVCELEYDQVREVCRLMATRKSSMHPDLGVFMNRHSTVTSCLGIILLAVCGRIGVPGGNVIPGYLMPIGSHSDERDPRTWRTVTTDFPAIMGTFPPNVMPEEILSDHPERLRAVLCSQSNPLRSYADTTAYEEAFGRLDLLVTCELAMTETAALSHYVLPARSAYESWDGTFFALTYPEVYFQARHPVLEPEGERLEVSQFLVRLADRLGLVPDVPDSLVEAARGDRLRFGAALMQYAQNEPRALGAMPFVLAKTLGRALGSANLAALWGLLQTVPASFHENAARAGFTPGPALGEEVFQALLDHPEGIWVGRCDEEKNLESLRTEHGRVDITYPEMREWIASITPEAEARALSADGEWPLVLMAGRHMDYNANTLMRDPAWNRGKRACTLAMNPRDAASLGLSDGRMVRVVTEAGEETIELEVTEATRSGMIVIPHGFGLLYQGRKYGANVNRLTKNTHRDPFAATPLHRYVPCRVEAL